MASCGSHTTMALSLRSSASDSSRILASRSRSALMSRTNTTYSGAGSCGTVAALTATQRCTPSLPRNCSSWLSPGAPEPCCMHLARNAARASSGTNSTSGRPSTCACGKPHSASAVWLKARMRAFASIITTPSGACCRQFSRACSGACSMLSTAAAAAVPALGVIGLLGRCRGMV